MEYLERALAENRNKSTSYHFRNMLTLKEKQSTATSATHPR